MPQLKDALAFAGSHRRRSAKLNAALSRLRDAGRLTFASDTVFELGEDAQELPEGRAHRGRGIDALFVAEDLNLAVVQLTEDVDQMPHGPCEAIGTPNDDLLELPLFGFDQESFQLWSSIGALGAGDLLSVDLGDCPA